jgi:hypothetical protein
MSREEELIRSTAHAIASTVREVPELRLEPAVGELSSPARTSRRAGRGPRRPWLTPLAAAALIVVLAVALVLIRDIPNGGAVPRQPATSTGPSGVPRYYVAINFPTTDTFPTQDKGGAEKLVVGDSLTGNTLATFPLPAGETFGNVTAAADDRTFVVVTLRFPHTGTSITAKWYEIQLAPGTADPARMTPLPIKPQTVTWSTFSLDGITSEVLSGSGKELAVAEETDTSGMVKVFSVATGRLLHVWSTNNSSVSLRGLAGAPSLTWINGDRALTVATIGGQTRLGKTYVERQTVRRLNVDGRASGDLLADSTVIRDVQVDGVSAADAVCGDEGNWPPVVSQDGKTFTCTAGFSFITFTMTAGSAARSRATLDYSVPAAAGAGAWPKKGTVLWTSPSGATLIGEWGATREDASGRLISATVGDGLHIGVISHGKFTPLRFPASFRTSAEEGIAF